MRTEVIKCDNCEREIITSYADMDFGGVEVNRVIADTKWACTVNLNLRALQPHHCGGDDKWYSDLDLCQSCTKTILQEMIDRLE